MDKKNPNDGTSVHRHQDLIDQFRNSHQTPKEFITRCLLNRMVSAADALELMTVLKSKVLTHTFTLADLSDEEFYRQGLYETSGDDVENSPLFVIQFSDFMRDHQKEVGELLEDFARKMAELVARHQEHTIDECDTMMTRKEAMDTILDTLPTDSVRH